MAELILTFTTSLSVTVLAMLALRPLAFTVDLLDRPGGRKTHHGEVPIVGGLAMFLGIALGSSFVPSPGTYGVSVLAAAALLVVLGLLDDRFDLSPLVRLPLQLAAPLLVFGAAAASLQISLGNPLGLGEIVIAPAWALAAVVVLVAGAVNAFNMLDGMDGLAGAVALVATLGLACLSALSEAQEPLIFSMVIAAAVCGFLIFNLPVQFNRSIRCFMGDAGSTLLGFLLALLCLRLTQEPGGGPVSPMAVLWLVAMPIYELLWTIIRRVSRGQSPFRPDREHLHHLLLDAGFSVRATFALYIAVSILLATIGILVHAHEISDPVAFAAFVVTGVATVYGFYRAGALARALPYRYQRLTESTDQK